MFVFPFYVSSKDTTLWLKRIHAWHYAYMSNAMQDFLYTFFLQYDDVLFHEKNKIYVVNFNNMSLFTSFI